MMLGGEERSVPIVSVNGRRLEHVWEVCLMISHRLGGCYEFTYE